MEDNRRQSGFSLIETMLAVATLAVGMMFVGGTFMAGVYFSSVSTERTIATVVTDEALAKIALYGLDPNNAKLNTAGFVPYEDLITIDPREFGYPSLGSRPYREYAWSALCRREGPGNRLVNFTIFVSRLGGANVSYWVRPTGSTTQLNPVNPPGAVPRPVLVPVAPGAQANELLIVNASDDTFMDAGSILVTDDSRGQIYRVVDRSLGTAKRSNRVTLDRNWDGATTPTASVWVVPPPIAGGRNPLVTVYQKVIRF